MIAMERFTYGPLEIRYRTWGNPKHPPLLLLHGFTGSHRNWHAFAQDWAAHYWLVVPDLPGHGASLAPDKPEALSVAKTAEALAALMASLSSSRYGLIGYSFGGRIGCHLLSYHRAQIGCAVLESSSPGIEDPALRAERRRQDTHLAQEIEEKGLEWFIPYWTHLPLFATQADLDTTRRQGQEDERRGHQAFGLAQSLRGAGTGTQASLWSVLPTISIPLLIITGALDAKYNQIGSTMHAAAGQSQWVSVAGAGHNVHLERPEEFFRVVSQFLSESTYILEGMDRS